MLASFLFPKKWLMFFLSYFILYFISRKFLFYLVFLFFNEVKTFTLQGGSQMKFFKKLRLRSLPYQAGLKINLVRSDVSAWMYECVQYFSFLIFLIFFRYWHLGRDAWVYWERMNIYTKSYDDLWECMYEIHSFHLC